MRFHPILCTIASFAAMACGQDQSQNPAQSGTPDPFSDPAVQQAMKDMPPEMQQAIEEAQAQYNQMLAALPTPGVHRQMDGLQRTVFARPAGMGPVGDMLQIDWNEDGTEDVVLLKGTSVVVCTATGEVIQAQSPSFGSMAGMTPADFVDVEGDGKWEILSGGAWVSPAQLMNTDGSVAWTYTGGGEGVNDTAPGDFDGDGQLEFAVGFNGGGGIHLLDSNGSVLWRQPDANVWCVAAIDSNGDGTLEILHSNAGGEFTLRDPANGAIIGATSPSGYFSQFSTFDWPGAPGQTSVIHCGEGVIVILDRTGQQVLQRPIPGVNELATVVATPVRLSAGSPTGWAALIGFQQMPISILVIFDSQDSEIHREVIGENLASILAIDLSDGERQSLLLGGDQNVWLCTVEQ